MSFELVSHALDDYTRQLIVAEVLGYVLVRVGICMVVEPREYGFEIAIVVGQGRRKKPRCVVVYYAATSTRSLRCLIGRQETSDDPAKASVEENWRHQLPKPFKLRLWWAGEVVIVCSPFSKVCLNAVTAMQLHRD